MTTTPGITGATGAAGLQPATADRSRIDKDTFLKLLVAQLKYQDPSKPVDSSEFVAQSAQFTMVEKLEELAAAAQQSAATERATTASAYLGRSITGADADGNPVKGLVSSVDVTADGIVLHVGDAKVALGTVTNVALAAAPTTTTTSNQEV
ncbi:MAG TPA: flagellar hook capping FlgD N-terminal domain-containing protein [Acidimicrobiales bacterium]|nr:flagellar hook capping FlgD N-terminal domain-containing protein [Acidimicrobiales bacterium]